VFAQGRVDIVVGNPPYIRQELLAAFKPYWEQRFKSYHGVADIFAYFFEQGVEVLRPGGRLAFITSGSWVRANFGAPLRKFLSGNVKMESMVDFGEFQPFEDVEMIRPSITVLSKDTPGGEMRVFKWLTAGRPPEALSDEIVKAPTIRTVRLQDSWELEPDSVIALREKLAVNGTPLREYAGGLVYRGVLSGLTEAYVVDRPTRDRLIATDPTCQQFIRPFVQGTHLRPWYIEEDQQYLLALRSSANFRWPWSEKPECAEQVFRETYPSVFERLSQFRDAAIKRTDQGEFWWELRSCDYWDTFGSAKIVWPDISKLPRFSMDTAGRYLGNTGYFIPTSDFYLLGVLSSWATWFFISKTSQPLRSRGDRWQYRLFTQSMENVPVPDAPEAERKAIACLARTCSSLGQERYQGQVNFHRRLFQAFSGGHPGPLDQKAEVWWELSLNQLGDALKQSFKLPTDPMKNPRLADEWEPYLHEKRDENARLMRALADAEAELNDRVYRLFNLTADEIKLLQKEVEH
jgi:Eco57I restriction-modification methylase